MNTIYEDDVINCMTNYLKLKGYNIVVSKGKQAKIFYRLKGKMRKSPDIIAIKENFLLVIEAKIKPKNTFKLDKRGFSDYTSLLYLLKNECIKTEFIDLVKCKSMDSNEVKFNLIPIVLANESYYKFKNFFCNDIVCAVMSDVLNNKIIIEKDTYNVLQSI